MSDHGRWREEFERKNRRTNEEQMRGKSPILRGVLQQFSAPLFLLFAASFTSSLHQFLSFLCHASDQPCSSSPSSSFNLPSTHWASFFSNQMKTNVSPLLLLVFFLNSKMLLAHSSSSTNFGLLSWACQRWKGSLQIHVKTHMNIWRTNLTLKPHLYYFQDQILLIFY